MKSILYIHIGGGLPAYLETNIKVFRRYNPFNPVFIYCENITPVEKEVYENMNCFFIHQKHFKLQKTPTLNHNGFIQRCIERFFLIRDIVEVFNIDFYAENDVMIFDSIDKIKFEKTFVQQTSDYHATPSVMGIEKKSYDKLIQFIIAEKDSDDMVILRKAITKGIIEGSNTYPEDGIEPIFDGASYGQFLGGTHESGPGWAEDAHYIGREILNKTIRPFFDGKPMVERDGKVYPLFNLHVHSKKLELFA